MKKSLIALVLFTLFLQAEDIHNNEDAAVLKKASGFITAIDTNPTFVSDIVLDPFSDDMERITKRQEQFTKQLLDLEYGSAAYKDQIQSIRHMLLQDVDVDSVEEIANGNGLLVHYAKGYTGVIYNAPDGTKGSAGSSAAAGLQEKINIFKRAAERSGNKKVLAIAAQYWDWGYDDDVPQLADMLSANGFDVTYKKYEARQSGQMSDFQGWGEYGIVLVSTHGTARDSRVRDNSSANVAIDLNVRFVENNYRTFETDISEKKLIPWSNCNAKEECHDTVMATEHFFKEYLQELPNTLLYISACHVGKHDALAEVFLGKGADTMIGYSDLVQVSFAKENGIDIFTRLIGNETIGEIFNLPVSDNSQGCRTGIKENDDTPAEIVVFTKQHGTEESSLDIDYGNLLAAKSYEIAGSFASYDFVGVDDAFDWVFQTANGAMYQLHGKTPTDNDVFGWSGMTSVPSVTPAWYMFPLGSDVDGDGSEKFDWIFVGINTKAVYKLAGVNSQGTFGYSEKIDIEYSIEGSQVIFFK